MSQIEQAIKHWEFARDRSLATLDTIAEMAQCDEVLGWQPQPGRAHICWQFMHIAVTEEIFATSFLCDTPPGLTGLVPRFRKGSTVDSIPHSLDEIRQHLATTREHLLESVRKYEGANLDVLTPGMQDRGWTVDFLLSVIAWHETHHQGQAHFCLNSWIAGQQT